MKARPILMSGPLVRAILEGRKTQTRRPVKPQPPRNSRLHAYYGEKSPRPALAHSFGWFIPEGGDLWPCNDEDRIRCPYGQPGDLLWVRETWGIVNNKYKRIAFRADTGTARACPRIALQDNRWRPSIFMPRFASRITLWLTGVRVERLQEISERDAMAEGMPTVRDDPRCPIEADHTNICRFRFAEKWREIYGANSWDQNPWVWVLRFEVIRANVDQVLKAAQL